MIFEIENSFPLDLNPIYTCNFYTTRLIKEAKNRLAETRHQRA